MLEVALKFHEHLGTTTSKYPPAVILILMNHENFLTFRGISNRITYPYLFRPYQHDPKQMRHYIHVAHHLVFLATMTEDRLCRLSMTHAHRNDTVGIPEAVLLSGIRVAI
jgi:hypothetical protein